MSFLKRHWKGILFALFLILTGLWTLGAYGGQGAEGTSKFLHTFWDIGYAGGPLGFVLSIKWYNDAKKDW